MRELSTSRRDHALGAAGDVVLPAIGATVGVALTGEPILVAHAGTAHVGLIVRPRLARRLVRTWNRRGELPCPATLDDAALGRGLRRPDLICFRWATGHAVRVIDGRLSLVLHVRGHHDQPGLRVECCVDAGLIRALEAATTPSRRHPR